MKRIISLLVALTLASSAAAQGVVTGGMPVKDVNRTLGIATNGFGSEAANRATLQAELDSTPAGSPLFWRGGSTNSAGYYLDNALVLPADSGRCWLGQGLSIPAGLGGAFQYGSAICCRALTWDTDFDGTANFKLTSSGAGATVIVTGRATVAADQYASVHITGGTNVTAGWYGIQSVSAGASGTGTWTLDRNWCTGTVTNGQGLYVPEIIRNLGCGTYHRGLEFTPVLLTSDYTLNSAEGFVCYHIMPNTGGIASGKHLFEHCSCGFSKVGILCGRYLAEAFGESDGEWIGYGDNHADHITTEHLSFNDISEACLYVNTIQSVAHEHSAWSCTDMEGHVFWFDAGGKLTASRIDIAGPASGETQGLLRLGPKVDGQVGPYIFRGVGFDGGSNTRNPQLIQTDWTGLDRDAVVHIDGVTITRGVANDAIPVVDIQSGCKLTISHLQAGTGGAEDDGLWADSIVLKTGATKNPVCLLDACELDITTTPEELIKDASSTGGTLQWRNCFKRDGTPIADGDYTVP